MKKVLIFLLAASLITGCKNNKAKDSRTSKDSTTTTKDDYNNKDNKNKDGNTTDNTKDNTGDKDNNNNTNNNTGNTNNNTSSNWSSADVDAFVTNCVSSAVGGGMQRSRAESYCSCMQRKLAELYPNPNDAGGLSEADMNSPSMQRLIKDCLY